MVDVGSKDTTTRIAKASGRVNLGAEAFRAVSENNLAKGDVLSVARNSRHPSSQANRQLDTTLSCPPVRQVRPLVYTYQG